jgi:hypothetical protein
MNDSLSKTGKGYLMDTVQIGKDFFDSISKMDHDELIDLINNEVGEELTSFLQNYSHRVASMTEDPNALKQSFHSMIILGYLLRGKVENAK